ncbi:hypothetical protein LR48_Vigan07g172300 [Vigna angularis]|uniref:DUF8039 domain-containing protein n=1 Tax=Phaseolus angularis TaxID=3914 RepID=A0A0L9UZS0_PHAAN|nr:hypothetical protein LR48_Vigan07g172300 [Vigna angularis]
MVDHPHSSGDEAPSSRPTRGATRLRQLMVRRNSGERKPVDFNMITGVTSGPNADVFRSYLGVLARDRINILTPSFDNVFEVDRNIIWNNLLDSLVEQSSQGQFTLEGRHDILTIKLDVLSTLDECMLLLRAELRMKLREELRTKLYDEVTTKVTDKVMCQFQQQFESYGMRPHPSLVQEPIVPPTGESGKGSCSTPCVPRDDMDDASPCLLYVLDGTEKMLVARGIVFQAVIVVHGMELPKDEVKVSVDDIIIPDASVPLPTCEIFIVAHAFQSFIAWLKHLVGSVSDPSMITSTKTTYNVEYFGPFTSNSRTMSYHSTLN